MTSLDVMYGDSKEIFVGTGVYQMYMNEYLCVVEVILCGVSKYIMCTSK